MQNSTPVVNQTSRGCAAPGIPCPSGPPQRVSWNRSPPFQEQETSGMSDPKPTDVLAQPAVDARSRLGEEGTRPAMQYDYTNFYFGAGDDAFALLDPFDQWWAEVEPEGYYQYEAPLQSAPTTRVDVLDKKTGQVRKGLINFASYNY